VFTKPDFLHLWHPHLRRDVAAICMLNKMPLNPNHQSILWHPHENRLTTASKFDRVAQLHHAGGRLGLRGIGGMPVMRA